MLYNNGTYYPYYCIPYEPIVGAGGGSVFTETVNGVSTPTLVYHYYDGNSDGTPTLGINRLAFTSDGWPVVQ